MDNEHEQEQEEQEDTQSIVDDLSSIFEVEESGEESSSTGDEGSTDGTSEQPPPPPSDYFEVSPGEKISRERARDLYNFDKWLLDNPTQALEIFKITSGQVAQQPPPPPAQPPEEIDLEDPTTRTLWNRIQQIEQSQQTSLGQLQQQQNQTIAAQIEEGIQDFQKAHPELEDSDIRHLRDRAAKITNMSNMGSNYTTAAFKALDFVYWSEDSYREKELQRRRDELVTQTKTDNTRKQKLRGISGSSGSVSRTPKVPETKEERRQAMIKDITDAMARSE